MADTNHMELTIAGAGSEADSEVATLRARCRDLEELLRAVLDQMPIVLWRVTPDGTFTFHDGKGLMNAGLQRGEHIGKNVFDLYPEPITAPVRRALSGELMHARNEAHDVSWEHWHIPSRDERGAIKGMVGVTLDTSETRRVEMELRAQLELVERQRRVIEDLSTPILQVWEGVLALPMIGVIDSARTADVMDNLLEAVSRQHARFAILDLTGVEAVDTKTAAYLIDLVRAIQLLGAEGVITGIRPSVAQTVVAIGVDLGSITTLGNLQAGLRYCLTQMRRK